MAAGEHRTSRFLGRAHPQSAFFSPLKPRVQSLRLRVSTSLLSKIRRLARSPGAEGRMKPAGAPLALGLHIVLGQDAPTMLKNMLRNYQEGRVGLVQGIASRWN